MITGVLRTYLLQHPQIASILGDRISAKLLQEGQFPAVKFTTVFGSKPKLLSSSSTTNEVRVRFHIFAGDYSTLDTVGKLFVERLESLAGTSSGGITVDACTYEGARDAEYEPEVNVYQRSLEFYVSYH